MAEGRAPVFATLLRRLRTNAGLTQEELAEAARMSARTVSDLERGISLTARKDTARLLADALELTGQQRAAFEAAARGRTSAGWLTGPEAQGLRAPLTSFVGRDQDLADVLELIGRARLITLTGAGGAGKTRLAIEVARSAAGLFADGAWLADLAGIATPALVVSRVMEALGVRQASERSAVTALLYRLQQAELLLVLDNCEHVLAACADLVDELLHGAPGLKVLATSREPLGVPGEEAYPVAPLGLPESTGDEAAAHAAAVRLFIERGAAANASAATGRAPVSVVARICRNLDGLPLAIELAAARMRSLTAEEIEQHLADKFRFLRYSQPVADSRHQTLKAAIDWSYQMLTEDERQLFRELSVFAGGFSLPAAAAVCCEGDTGRALDLIDRLVAKSLLEADAADGETRYRTLATIREYAAEHLDGSAGADQARRKHAITFLRVAEQERELDCLAREHDNFRAALDWSLAAGLDIGPRLAAALGGFWLARGFLDEGASWLQRALPLAASDASMHATLLRLQGAVLRATGRLDQARLAFSEAEREAAAVGLGALQARIRCELAEITVMSGGSMRQALTQCRQNAEILESAGDKDGSAEAWYRAGNMCYYLGDWPADEEALNRALEHAVRSGNRYLQLEIRMFLAITLRTLRLPADVAIGRVEQLITETAGERWAEAEMLQQLACLLAYAGRFADARDARARGRSMLAGFGARHTLALVAIHSGMVELTAGDPVAAERELRTGYEELTAMGDRRSSSMITSLLAQALYEQGRLDEALRLAEETAQLAHRDDVEPQARYRAVRAKILAKRHRVRDAAPLCDEAVAHARQTSKSALLAEMLLAKAEVSRLAGATAEATACLSEALQIYEQRGAVPLADRVRATLANGQAPYGLGPVQES